MAIVHAMNDGALPKLPLSFPPPQDAFHGGEAAAVVRMFTEIENSVVISQETLASRLGIAVGLTNSYIKRCVHKGLIKLQKVPTRRYAYFLTPTGFAEKAALTAEYLSHSFSFFRRARAQCHSQLEICVKRGWTRILLAGTGELAEVAVLSAMELPEVKLVGVLAPGRNISNFAGLPVLHDVPQGIDAVFLTDTADPNKLYRSLLELVSDERILLVPLLHIVRKPRQSAET